MKSRLDIRLAHPAHSSEDLVSSTAALLERTRLLSMATVASGGGSYINTAYFAYDASLQLYVLTEPTTVHGQNLAAASSVAATVFETEQEFGSDLQGLQIFGTGFWPADTGAEAAYECYANRYPLLRKWVPTFKDYQAGAINSRFLCIDVETVKIFDEPRFGKEVFILTRVERG